MALFFNAKLLEEYSGNDPEKYLTLLNYWYTKTIPKNRTKVPLPKKPLHGESFLLKPDPVIINTYYDSALRVQYIRLAARRDFLLYKLYGETGLDLSFFPDVDIDKIKRNPLLAVVNNKLKFKFEE